MPASSASARTNFRRNTAGDYERRPPAVRGGQWAVGGGRGAVGGGRWAVGGGQWAVGSGQWAVGSGQWAVGGGHAPVTHPKENTWAGDGLPRGAKRRTANRLPPTSSVSPVGGGHAPVTHPNENTWAGAGPPRGAKRRTAYRQLLRCTSRRGARAGPTRRRASLCRRWPS